MEAVGKQDRERATQLAQRRLMQRTVGERSQLSFDAASDEDLLLDRVALAYELAVLEGLDVLCGASAHDNEQRDLAMAGAFCAFELRRLLPVPDATHDRLFYVLRLAALAYIGTRGPDLRRWFEEAAPLIRQVVEQDVACAQVFLPALVQVVLQAFDGQFDRNMVRGQFRHGGRRGQVAILVYGFPGPTESILREVRQGCRPFL